MFFSWVLLYFQQNLCCVRGAAGGRVLPSEECRHSGRKGHAHHSQTRPHVPPPPLGAERRRPLHRRERQTRACHTQVIPIPACHVILQDARFWHDYKNRFLVASPTLLTPLTLCTNYICTGYVVCVVDILFFCLILSPPSSHAWSCCCVSRAMFPETEPQAVSQMTATESNYPPAVLSARWWGFGFFFFLNLSASIHAFPSFLPERGVCRSPAVSFSLQFTGVMQNQFSSLKRSLQQLGQMTYCQSDLLADHCPADDICHTRVCTKHTHVLHAW